MEADFQKSAPELPGSPAAPIFKFEREDWALFRTIEGLQQKAGVPKSRLARLVLKEIVDNALDESAKVYISNGSDGYFVEDHGRGIDGTPDEIARLFSISRPLVSTKLLRLPNRGTLGNGLRVVASAVLASEGSLAVVTRNRRIELRPERDGTTTVVSISTVDFPVGTRIEIVFGPALSRDPQAFSWARMAGVMARGETYAGRSSPWWYDVPQFQELLSASGNTPVRELIASLDGCTGGKAGEIVAAANLNRALCGDVATEQAARLLAAARESARPVNPERLGAVGPDAFSAHAYARASETVKFGAVAPFAEVPTIVEAWAQKLDEADADTVLTVCVNRTPVASDVSAARDKRDIDAFGCGLHHTIATAPAGTQFQIVINVISPYVPITSDGKEPDLLPFFCSIESAVQKAVRKAHRPASAGKRLSQKDIVLDHLADIIAVVRGEEEYRFNPRQLLYRLRPIVREQTGQELQTNNFNQIITDYEAENGEIEGMYREPRGSIYHPHRRETIPLGTLMVEEYERPIWNYNKLVHIEKEGFSEALKAVNWAERHDCALTSTKGFTTRAIRDLVDKLAEHDEPVTVFLVTDADAYGTMIYQTFQEATKARGARKIKIVHLGLHPWEALADGLEFEEIPKGDKRKAVANYVLEREDGEYWEEWLQTHRVELNAMTTPQFIEWLDRKMAEHGDGKLIPPPDEITRELEDRLETHVRAIITERILREANLEGQIAEALTKIERPASATLPHSIREMFESEPEQEWRAHVERIVAKIGKTAGDTQ